MPTPGRALAAASLVLASAFAQAAAGPTQEAAVPDGAVLIPVGAAIQAIIDRHPPGTVYVLQPGVHRLQQIIPKDGDTVMGQPGAVLNGAQRLHEFTRLGGLFVATGQWPHPGTRQHGVCQPDFPRCDHPQDLFLDGAPLRAVAKLADVRPGTWHLDLATGQVHLADDPSGRWVELSHLPFAVGGAAARVTVRNLVVENYASANQEGAINHSGAGVGWVISDNEVRWNHGYGIRLGSANKALRNNVHHNGQLGIGGGTGSAMEVQGNEIAFNAWNGTSCEWECGGAKWGAVRDLVVTGNRVYRNGGVGLWTDVGSSGVLFEGNRVEGNRLAGISHEVSHDAVIRRNVLCGNGKDTFQWGWQGQIQVQNSTDTQVYGNQVILHPDMGGNGITVIEQNRGAQHTSRAVHVHGNVVTVQGRRAIAAGWFADHDAAAFKRNDNWFDRNTYRLVARRPGDSLWNANAPSGFTAWQASGQDPAGTVSETEVSAKCPAGPG